MHTRFITMDIFTTKRLAIARSTKFLLMVCILSLLSGFLNIVHGSVGKVLYAIGDVHVKRDTTLPLKKDDDILEHDVITTGSRSRIQLLMIDGARIALQQNSQLAIDDYKAPKQQVKVTTQVKKSSGSSTLNLLKGGFRTITGTIGNQQNKDAYKVRTPVATIGIRGTDYSIFLGGGIGTPGDAGPENNLYAGVSQGSIWLQNDGGKLDLNENEFAFVANKFTSPRKMLAPPPSHFGQTIASKEKEQTEEEDDSVKETDQPETESMAETESETESVADSESESETESVADAESESESETELVAEAESETESATDTESESESETELIAEAESETESIADTESESDTESVADAGSDSGSESEPSTETAQQTESVTEVAEADTGSESSAQADNNTQTLSQNEQSTETPESTQELVISATSNESTDQLELNTEQTAQVVEQTSGANTVVEQQQDVAITTEATDESGTTVSFNDGQLSATGISLSLAAGSFEEGEQLLMTTKGSAEQLVRDSNKNLIAATVIIPIDDNTAREITADMSSATNYNNGFDSAAKIRWGRWSKGFANFIITTTDRQNISSSTRQLSVDLSQQSLHWIAADNNDTNAILPSTGSATYILSGNTDPTNNHGQTGVLGSASFSANFTNQTVSNQLQIGIANQTWNANGSGSIHTGSIHFEGNYNTVSINGSNSGNGNFAGFFSGFNSGAGSTPAGAGLTYILKNATGGDVITGAAVFGK